MPTENERKYVLRLDCEQQICSLSTKHLRIIQGYVNYPDPKGSGLGIPTLSN
jgi:hypothetical protein